MTNELDRLRADLKSMSEYAMKLDASNDDYQAELARTTAGLELSRQVASSLDESLEAANARIEQQNTVIHGMQDGSLARDQMGVIARANARIAELEKANSEIATETLRDHRVLRSRAERAEARVAELEILISTAHDRLCLREDECDLVTACEQWVAEFHETDKARHAAIARAERAEAERDAMREVCIGVDHVASIEERYGGHVSWTNTWIETVAKARAALNPNG